ncbi:MAG: putative toxin-antitoxin system toxin component, PIN family [Pseudomonadota bacterium]
MKLVLDTNVVASALLWGGAPRLLLQAGRDRRVLLFTCTALLAELTDILARPKFAAKIAASTLTVDELVDRYAALASLVRPSPTPRIAPDPDDDVVIGTALAAQARWVVTGDKPLLSVTEHQGVRIVSVAEALQGIPPADADSPVS